MNKLNSKCSGWLRSIQVCTIVLIVTLIAGGCSSTSGFPDRSDEVEARLKSLNNQYFLPKKDVYQEYTTQPNETKKREYRNEVTYARMRAIDLGYSTFKRAIYEEGVTSNLGLDILGVGVGGAGAAATGATASRILSALSGGIAGTRSAINERLYFERTMPALLALMDATRDSVKAQIIQGLQQSVEAYPLGQALSDLERYYLSGSIPGAIGAVTQIAGTKSEEAAHQLKIQRTKAFVDPQAQQTVNKLLDNVNNISGDDARQLLTNPPVELTSQVKQVTETSAGGKALEEIQDETAKTILKRVIVLMQRAPEDLEKWEAAIKAQIN